MEELSRYSVIADKNPREIVLLRGFGCAWRRCRFCDYHLDCSADGDANFALTQAVLARVTGRYDRLEVINSGSFFELDEPSVRCVEQTLIRRGIHELHIESHWLYKDRVSALRARFAALGVNLHVKIGVETFDADFRERVLQKGMGDADAAQIAAVFDDCCLLFGLFGQTADSMTRDIETGLSHFSRVCVNLMTKNSSALAPDAAVCGVFSREVYPRYRDNPRVDILMQNTDFGVGGKNE